MSITIAEYQNKLREMMQDNAKEVMAIAIIPAANELLADIKDRIAQEGKKSDGNKLSNYSTNPTYYEKERFVKKSAFKPQGHPNKGRNLKGLRKSMYIEDGYKGLRAIQGMVTEIKNLTYTGDMMLSYVLGREKKDVVIGFNKESESIKRQELEDQEGLEINGIFGASDEEIEDYSLNFKKSYIKLIKEDLR